ncbi:4-alpha-glucanotransferase [Sinomonas sp. ASV322]|uniref:4-alpha-glucanotransferase n=1 Tax=Sinomonas sp. ASV322 TaxID=3041920 RepID=UPI0027DC134B|nr:4-alpha-glucanotransferase [Sinomonas sp. ASV322]MDQ4504117.1 4-alpha-glucanotransferase [Sinomonas sp. ASV322]
MADGTELLLDLARRHGVATSFYGWDGVDRPVSHETLRKVLTALGVPADSPDDLERGLRDAELAPWRRLLPPIVVQREGGDRSVHVHVSHGSQVEVWITAEDGSRHEVTQEEDWEEPRVVDGVLTGRATFALPRDLPLGWHSLHAEALGGSAECPLVVTPARLHTTERLLERRHWGLMAQLYSVRSSRSWGIGDFADLADLAAIAGSEGASFVLVNPLHAAAPTPPIEDSPYLPATRRFFNPLYVRVEEIDEYGYLAAAARDQVEGLAARTQPANHSAGLLDRNTSFAAKLAALELLSRVPRSPARELQFRRFCAEHGSGLDDFALWCALREKLSPDAPEWAGADQQRDALAGRIEFYRWLQWICDEQLEAAQRAATRAGMGIGVVHDLAVGVEPHGADAWILSDVLAQGVTVGAPPDVFNQQGQNWSQPPWHPGRLEASGYAAFRDMLRTILRHAGGIRVDHVLGLFRLWWIPEGAGPEEGTYVYYDHEALVGILALEAQRADAIVIGEDLGVFEPWVRDYLAERGIFGTSILWFEHDGGGPLAPERYRQQCLTSVNTHDLPPTAGYLAGEHVTLRESLGLLRRPVEEELAADATEQEAVLERVRERGLLSPRDRDHGDGDHGDGDHGDGGGPGRRRSPEEVQRTVEALYAFTALTPSSLLGVALVDAVGETRTQNQPGTHLEYPNWRIPLAGPDGQAVLLDELAANPRFASLTATVRGALGG